MSEPSQMVVRVAIAISGAPFPSPASIRKARAAIEAMRQPGDAVICAVENKAEERYNAAPDMMRWYGEDVWAAGIDAALASPPKE
jgi:hypothetical protein